MARPKTIFLDIDGCVFKHQGPPSAYGQKQREVLPGVYEKFDEWEAEGARIILTTGVKESLRETVVRDLSEAHIIYDLLIMGIGGGDRYLINDLKPDGHEAAIAVNIERDKGLGNVNL